MLRDEPEAALDDVIVALKRAADAYADAAEIVREREPALADMLAALATRRDGMAAELERQFRRLGDLPSDPDSEAETVEAVVRHLKATFGDEGAVVRDEALAREDELRALIDHALSAGAPEGAVTLLRAFREEIAAERSNLVA